MARRGRTDVGALVPALGPALALAACLLLTHQVSGDVVGHVRHSRSLLDDDLISPVLSMFSGPRSRCCKQLTLCDLATTLLEAVEANKAQDVDTIRSRKPNADRLRLPPLFPRNRRAHRTDEDTPPNPILMGITRNYMRTLRQDEDCRRRLALQRAQETLDRERRRALEAQADDEDDEDEAPSDTPNASSSTIQIISK